LCIEKFSLGLVSVCEGGGVGVLVTGGSGQKFMAEANDVGEWRCGGDPGADVGRGYKPDDG
jgi:hypothetical protein